MKTKRPPDFIASSTLLEAAERAFGKADPASIGKVMRGRGRARVRQAQYQLIMEKRQQNEPSSS
jgi:hypothetical protein